MSCKDCKFYKCMNEKSGKGLCDIPYYQVIVTYSGVKQCKQFEDKEKTDDKVS